MHESSLSTFKLPTVSLAALADDKTHFGRIHRSRSGKSPEHDRSDACSTLTDRLSLRICRIDSTPAPVIPIIRFGGFVRRLNSGGTQTASHASSSYRVLGKMPRGGYQLTASQVSGRISARARVIRGRHAKNNSAEKGRQSIAESHCAMSQLKRSTERRFWNVSS